MPAVLLVVLWGAACPATEAAAFRDALGRTVVLPETPQRIVSLAPHLTEILFAIGAGPRVVGVTAYCDYPEEARALPRIGGFSDPSAERVLAVRPDLVLATTVGNRREAVERLVRLGIPVFVTRVQRVLDVPRQIRLVGRLVGRREAADRVAAALARRLERVIRRVQGRRPVRVYYQVWDKPLITVSRGSFVDDAIRLAGGVNVFAGLDQRHPRVSREAVVAARPEVMVLSGMGQEDARLKREWLRFTAIPAVAHQRVYVMDSDFLHRPGPRIVEGVERLARWFHPEAFRDGESESP